MKMQLCFGFLILGLVQFSARAGTSYEKYPVPKKGGNLNIQATANPSNLSPILQSDLDSRTIAGNFYLPLFGIDGETYETYPIVAEKLEVSKDKKDYTYTLNKLAKWTDGTPVTTDDVQYSFERLMDPKVESAALRGYYAGVKFTKIDDRKFTFHIDDPKFNSEESLDLFNTFQKKQFVNEPDFNKSKEHLHPIGTGPFILKSFSRDNAIVLERIPNWWGKDLPQFRAQFNQDTWTYKIIPDPSLGYEKFLKGDIDMFTFTADQFVNQVKKNDSDKVGNSAKDGKKVWASKLPTDGPLGWTGIALNAKLPQFSSVNTRKGISYLIDYKNFIDKVYFGLNDQSVSPFGSKTDNTDPGLRANKGLYAFDVKKASELFEKDGWKREPGQPFLMKDVDGKKIPFHFTLKFGASNPAAGKIAAIMKESFKKSGVDVEIRAMEATALYKDFDDKEFEALFISWGGGTLSPDPKQLWSTESIDHGSNKVSYSNAKVDALIRQADLEFNKKKRAKIMQQISKILYDECPYIFLFEKHFVLQGINSRFQSPKWIERYDTEATKELFHE